MQAIYLVYSPTGTPGLSAPAADYETAESWAQASALHQPGHSFYVVVTLGHFCHKPHVERTMITINHVAGQIGRQEG